MKWLFFIVFVFLSFHLMGQKDAELLLVKSRMDSIISFKADLSLKVDLDYVNIPTKFGQVVYDQGEPLQIVSKQFMMVPKKGLDFQLDRLLKYEYITVDRGGVNYNGKSLKQLNIIPVDKKADFSIATVTIDPELNRLVISEISTKKEGTYTLHMYYEKPSDVLPNTIEVVFEVERLKIPIDYIAKEANLDKRELEKDSLKTGTIVLKFSNYDIQYLK